MVGLIDKQMGAQPGAKEAAKPLDQEDESTNQPVDGQYTYDRVIAAAGRILYSEQGTQAALDTLKQSAQSPAAGIAAVVTSVMRTIMDKAQGSLPAEVILQALEEVTELVAELGQESKTIQVDDQLLQQAATEVVTAAIQAGIITEQMIQEQMAGMDQEEINAIRQQFEGGA